MTRPSCDEGSRTSTFCSTNEAGTATSPRFSAAANTSALVNRPPLPVPLRREVSTFSSSTMRRTAGERTCEATDLSSGSLEALDPSPVAAGFFSPGASLAGADFESSIVATTSPIFTSWPSGTFVSSTPACSATISVETLSVSSVNKASPALTYSPDFLCQTDTTPLEMDSPTAGILTSALMDNRNYAQSSAWSNSIGRLRPAVAGLRRAKEVGRQRSEIPNPQSAAIHSLGRCSFSHFVKASSWDFSQRNRSVKSPADLSGTN